MFLQTTKKPFEIQFENMHSQDKKTLLFYILEVNYDSHTIATKKEITFSRKVEMNILKIQRQHRG